MLFLCIILEGILCRNQTRFARGTLLATLTLLASFALLSFYPLLSSQSTGAYIPTLSCHALRASSASRACFAWYASFASFAFGACDSRRSPITLVSLVAFLSFRAWCSLFSPFSLLSLFPFFTRKSSVAFGSFGARVSLFPLFAFVAFFSLEAPFATLSFFTTITPFALWATRITLVSLVAFRASRATNAGNPLFTNYFDRLLFDTNDLTNNLSSSSWLIRYVFNWLVFVFLNFLLGFDKNEGTVKYFFSCLEDQGVSFLIKETSLTNATISVCLATVACPCGSACENTTRLTLHQRTNEHDLGSRRDTLAQPNKIGRLFFLRIDELIEPVCHRNPCSLRGIYGLLSEVRASHDEG